MSYTDRKITQAEINAHHVQGATDYLIGNPQQNKAVFDDLPEFIAGKFNDLIDEIAGQHGDEIRAAVDEWLAEHPEVTTTVQDNSLTTAKYVDGSVTPAKLDRTYTTPSDLNVLEARMDAFASLPSGSTSGNAELLDIRVGANGYTYPSAGDAARYQGEEIIKVSETGKNIADDRVFLYPTGWQKGDGYYYGTALNLWTAFSTVFPIPVSYEANTQYTVSFEAYNTDATESSSGNTFKVVAEYTDGTSSSLIYVPTRSLTFTLRKGTTTAGKTVRRIKLEANQLGAHIWQIRNFQIEKGRFATEYEPFTLFTRDDTARKRIGYLFDDLTKNADIAWAKGGYNASGVFENGNEVCSNAPSDIVEIDLANNAYARLLMFKDGVYLGKVSSTGTLNKVSSDWTDFKGKIDVLTLYKKYDANGAIINVLPSDGTTITTSNAQSWGDSVCSVIVWDRETDDETIPSYYTGYETAISNARGDMGAAGFNGFSFIFTSDQHWEVSQRKSPLLIKDALHRLNLQNLVLGGDLIDGQPTQESAMAKLADAFDAYNLGNNTFYIQGNHDSNTVGQTAYPERHLSNEQIYSVCMRQLADKVVFSDFGLLLRMPYYYDVQNLKTRLIFVDTYIEGIRIYQSQLDWITATLQSAPSDYKIIIFAHVWCEIGNDEFGLQFARQGEQIIEVADAFNQSSTGAKIVAMFGGHVHKDANYVTESGINLILIDCDTMRTNSSYGNVAGTQTESCFDIVTVDYGNKAINCRRVGRGIDRTFSYSY